MRFDEFWSRAIAHLKNYIDHERSRREARLFVSSWHLGKGFTDEKFPVRDVTPEKITCLTIHAGKAIDIPRTDMATLCSIWDEYVQGMISRLEIVEKIPRPLYAISLMKFLKESIN